MIKIMWLVTIILTGAITGIFAPFPLILVPVLLGGLVSFAIASGKLNSRTAFLSGLGAIYISVFVIFMVSMTTSGQQLAESGYGFNLPGDSSDHAIYLLFAIAETIFYLLTVLILKAMLLPLVEANAEQGKSVNGGDQSAHTADRIDSAYSIKSLI